jgi:hypothetical protein
LKLGGFGYGVEIAHGMPPMVIPVMDTGCLVPLTAS